MKYIKIVLIVTTLFIVSGFTDCYKPVTNSGLPKHIRKVAVPVFQFEAKGLRYRVESRFTEAVIREVIRRGNELQYLDGNRVVYQGSVHTRAAARMFEGTTER